MDIFKTKEECDHIQFLITEKSNSGRIAPPAFEEIETLSLGKIFKSTCLCQLYNCSKEIFNSFGHLAENAQYTFLLVTTLLDCFDVLIGLLLYKVGISL